jgi:hypothetical protein
MKIPSVEFTRIAAGAGPEDQLVDRINIMDSKGRGFPLFRIHWEPVSSERKFCAAGFWSKSRRPA